MADFQLPETADQVIGAVAIAKAPRPVCVPSSIYVIGFATGGGPLKVGIADNPPSRLRGLQTASPYELALLFHENVGISAQRLEFAVHWVLEKHRVRGEWFSVTLPEALAAIEQEKPAACAHKRELKPPRDAVVMRGGKRVLIPGKHRS